MAWRKCTFLQGLTDLGVGFDTSLSYSTLALVWRVGDEYSVMPSWLVEKILEDMEEPTLRVVLWVTRPEYNDLMVNTGRASV